MRYIVDFPKYGTCYWCGETNVPVTKWNDKWWCDADLQVARDTTKSKFNAIEKPVEDFNELIRKTHV